VSVSLTEMQHLYILVVRRVIVNSTTRYNARRL